MKNEVEQWIEELNAPGKTAAEVLRLAAKRLHPRIALASSFSAEDVVLIDLLHAIAPSLRIFAIDTGRLPEETHKVAQRVVVRYGVNIDWYFPSHEAVERLVRAKGAYSFHESVESRLECCAIRKVEPLQRALAGVSGWITGQRRGQSGTRSELPVAQLDHANGGIVKINPLANWTRHDVWAYLREKKAPFNELYDEGYVSIGCAPCSRAIESGEDERSGRWWWEEQGHKECGLHSINARNRRQP